jgi:nicotinamidase-related amidase
MIEPSGADPYGPATASTYSRAGFGSTFLRGSRPAVVVVDLSRGFTEDRFPTGANLTEVVQAAGRVVDAGHRVGAPVLFTTIGYTEAELRSGAVTWLMKATGMGGLVEGSPESALDPRLPVAADDVVLTKKGASAFAGTPLASYLTSWRVDTLIVLGATTSGCVRATAVDAVAGGLPVLVAQEACGDRASGPHAAALFDLHAKYADVLSVDQVVDYLHHCGAGEPEISAQITGA